MAARDVDSYLTGAGSALPVTGGIVKRQPYMTMKQPKADDKNVSKLVEAAA